MRVNLWITCPRDHRCRGLVKRKVIEVSLGLYLPAVTLALLELVKYLSPESRGYVSIKRSSLFLDRHSATRLSQE